MHIVESYVLKPALLFLLSSFYAMIVLYIFWYPTRFSALGSGNSVSFLSFRRTIRDAFKR